MSLRNPNSHVVVYQYEGHDKPFMTMYGNEERDTLRLQLKASQTDDEMIFEDIQKFKEFLSQTVDSDGVRDNEQYFTFRSCPLKVAGFSFLQVTVKSDEVVTETKDIAKLVQTSEAETGAAAEDLSSLAQEDDILDNAILANSDLSSPNLSNPVLSSSEKNISKETPKEILLIEAKDIREDRVERITNENHKENKKRPHEEKITDCPQNKNRLHLDVKHAVQTTQEAITLPVIDINDFDIEKDEALDEIVVSFSVLKSGRTALTASVDYTIFSRIDFDAVELVKGTLHFLSGEGSKSMQLRVKDRPDDKTGIFSIQLSHPVNATLNCDLFTEIYGKDSLVFFMQDQAVVMDEGVLNLSIGTVLTLPDDLLVHFDLLLISNESRGNVLYSDTALIIGGEFYTHKSIVLDSVLEGYDDEADRFIVRLKKVTITDTKQSYDIVGQEMELILVDDQDPSTDYSKPIILADDPLRPLKFYDEPELALNIKKINLTLTSDTVIDFTQAMVLGVSVEGQNQMLSSKTPTIYYQHGAENILGCRMSVHNLRIEQIIVPWMLQEINANELFQDNTPLLGNGILLPSITSDEINAPFYPIIDED